jgi:hypothetical protein
MLTSTRWSYTCLINGLFTLSAFVSETSSDSDRRHHLTVLALATLGGTTQIGLFLMAKVSK